MMKNLFWEGLMKAILGGCIFILIVISGIAFADETGHGQQSHNGFTMQSVIAPLGIVTLILLISTFILGFLVPKNRKKLFPLHRKMAITTIVVAVIHASVVFIFH